MSIAIVHVPRPPRRSPYAAWPSRAPRTARGSRAGARSCRVGIVSLARPALSSLSTCWSMEGTTQSEYFNAAAERLGLLREVVVGEHDVRLVTLVVVIMALMALARWCSTLDRGPSSVRRTRRRSGRREPCQRMTACSRTTRSRLLYVVLPFQRPTRGWPPCSAAAFASYSMNWVIGYRMPPRACRAGRRGSPPSASTGS